MATFASRLAALLVETNVQYQVHIFVRGPALDAYACLHNWYMEADRQETKTKMQIFAEMNKQGCIAKMQWNLFPTRNETVLGLDGFVFLTKSSTVDLIHDAEKTRLSKKALLHEVLFCR